MYVRARLGTGVGLKGYYGMTGLCPKPRRRGLGMSCPGDPECPGYVDPYLNAAQQAQGGTCNCVGGILTGTCGDVGNSCGALSTAQSAAQAKQALALQAAVDPTTLGGWLNVNSGIVTAIAGVATLVLLMRGAR